MRTDESDDAPAALPEGRFIGRGEFAELIRYGLAAAAAQNWREIILCDRDFEDWPLGERAVVQALNDWSRAGRKFTMLAKSYDTLFARHARFVSWRKNREHIVDCRRSAVGSGDTLPSALWTSGWVLERQDLQRCIGTAGSETGRRAR